MEQWRTKSRRFLALLLSAVMCMGMLNITAMASGEEPEDQEPPVCEEHQWGEWEAVLAPSCEEEGKAAVFCEVCGEQGETRAIDATGHEWEVDEEQEDGVLYRCVNCGAVRFADGEPEEEIVQPRRSAKMRTAAVEDGEGGIEPQADEGAVTTVEGLKAALNNPAVTEITLGANIDMSSEPWVGVVIEADRNLVIDGGGYTISGMKVNMGNEKPNGTGVIGDGGSCDYYAGFIANNQGNLTIKNLKFDGALVDIDPLSVNEKSTGSSILAVVCANNVGTLRYKDITVENSTVKGYTKLGILHGFTQKGGSFVAERCTVTGSTVELEADGTGPLPLFAGILIGYAPGGRSTTKGICMENNNMVVSDVIKTAYQGYGYALNEREDGSCYISHENSTYNVIASTYAGTEDTCASLIAETGGFQYETLQDAIEAAEDGDTVTLLADVEIETAIDATKSITIDGGAEKHSVTVTGKLNGDSGRAFNINKSDGLNVTFKNMKIVGPTTGTYTRGISAYEAKNLNLTLDNVELSASYYALNVASRCDNAKVTVTGSNLTGWCAFQTHSPNSNITVTNSTLTGINDKSYSEDGWNVFQTIVVNTSATNSKVVVENSTIEAKIAEGEHNEQMIASVRNGSSVVELTGCAIKAEGTYKKTNSAETVTLSPDNVQAGIDDGGKLIVDGKTYVGIPDFGISVPLKEMEEAAIAEVNGANYFTLESALNAAANGETVTLLQDVTEDATLTSGKSVTLDATGHTVKATLMVDNGTLTVKGGTFDTTERGNEGTNDHCLIAWKEGAKIVVDGGTFNAGCTVAYAADSGEVEINAGDFSAKGNWGTTYLLNLKDGSSSKITVKGGTFHGYDPSNSSSENPRASFVAEGSMAQETNGVWTIVPATGNDYVATVGNTSYKTLQAAIDAAKSGETVKLLKNTAESVTIAEGQTITLDLNGKKLEGSTENKDYTAIEIDGATISKGTVTNCGTLTIKDSANGTGEDAMGKIVGMNVVYDQNNNTSGKIALVNMPGATCTIESGMVTRETYLDGQDHTAAMDWHTSNYTVQNMGTMNITGGLIVNNSNYSNLVVNFTKKNNSYVNGFKAVMNISGGTLRQDTMSALKNDPGAEMNISGDAAVVWRVANENNYATNFYGTVNMTGGTIRTNGIIPVFTWKDRETEFPGVFNVSGNANLECNILEANNGVVDSQHVTTVRPTLNISGNPSITVNKMQTVCWVDDTLTAVANRTSATINISGGTFSTAVPEEYCADGFLPIANTDGTYGVSNGGLVLTPSVTSMTGSGTVTLRTTIDGTAVNATVTGNNNVTVTGSNGTYTVSLPNTSATYTFTASFGGKTATCTVTVTRRSTGGGGGGGSYRPSTRPSNGGTVNIDDPDVPLTERPFLFTDVTENDWYYEGVKYVFDKEMMNGVTDTAFAPQSTTTRGMIATILYRLEGSPAVETPAPFTDVAEGRYYTDAVAWASANGIVKGYDGNVFKPDTPITREQMAAILHRYAAFKGYDVTGSAELNGFADAASVSTYAVEPMGWARAAELISGVDGRLLPQGDATRAQIAAILMRFCENVAK